MQGLDFRQIQFGKAAAENERDFGGEILEAGFFNLADMRARLLHDASKFIVMGPKGSGKSAIGYHLELISSPETHEARVYRLDNFPFDALPNIIKDSSESRDYQYRRNWEFLIYYCIFDMLSSLDIATNAINLKDDILDFMEARGWSSGQDLSTLTRRLSSESAEYGGSVGFQAPSGFDLGLRLKVSKNREYNVVQIEPSSMLEILRDYCLKSTYDSPVIIILDGLDDALDMESHSVKAISSLMLALSQVNRSLLYNNTNIRVVALCRTDVWHLMSSNNLQKLRDDNCLEIQWYVEGKPNYESNLVKLINHRASTSVGEEIDVFKSFLPAKIPWKGKGNASALKVILEHTRHVPRDLINIMNMIQDFSKHGKPDEYEIMAAIKAYGRDKFEGEIRDSLSGLIDDKDIEHAMELLTALPQQEFSLKAAQEAVDEHPVLSKEGVDAYKLLKALFNAHAIGQVRVTARLEDRFTFKYRNPTAKFNPKDNCWVHPALFRALHGDVLGDLP